MKRKRASSDKDAPTLGLEIETPGVSAQNPISITDLTATIRDLLETGLGEIWVAGEISNFRAPGSGHLYFTLKDETATLSAVMFRPEARRAGFALTDGQAVLARVVDAGVSVEATVGVAHPVPFLVVRTRPMSGPAGLFIGVRIDRFQPPHSLTGPAERFHISPRELQVLALLLDGATRAEADSVL